MSQVVDQGDETELSHLTTLIEEQALANYFHVTGFPPLKERTPTLRQWAVLFYRLFEQQSTPYADFGVWLPFDEKLGKEMKYLVWRMGGMGGYVQVERVGPRNTLQWEAS